MNTQTTGLKFDQGKAPMSLLDRPFLEGVANVLAFGARKYDREQWRAGFNWTRLTDAAMRHLLAFIDGEDLDSESGQSHIFHAGCCLMFLARMIQDRPDLDDRWVRLKHDDFAAAEQADEPDEAFDLAIALTDLMVASMPYIDGGPMDRARTAVATYLEGRGMDIDRRGPGDE